MRRLLLAVVVLAVGAGSQIASASRLAAATPAGFARLSVGDSARTLIALVGRDYSVCTSCMEPTWLYEFKSARPYAAGGFVVRFGDGRVAALARFTATTGPSLMPCMSHGWDVGI
jgi:hypothetical protein